MGLRQVWPGELPVVARRSSGLGPPVAVRRPPAPGGLSVVAQTARARGAARVLGGSCRLQRVTRRLDS